MSDLQLYATGFAAVDGKALMEATSIKINKNPAMNPVKTLGKGFAGMSLGAKFVEMTIANATPTTDFEMSPDQYMEVGTVVEVTIDMSGRQSVHKGFITGAEYDGSVDQPGSLSMTFMCQWGNFE